MFIGRTVALLRIFLFSLITASFAFAARGATITVTGTSDAIALDGQCSLREAIVSANTNVAPNADCTSGAVGADTIQFAIPGGPLPHTINITSPLPSIVERVTIDAYTQSGATRNTAAIGFNGAFGIALDGASAGVAAGFHFTTGSNQSILDGFIVNNFQGPAVRINASQVEIRGCQIGLGGGNGGGTSEAAIVIRALPGLAADGNIIGGTGSSVVFYPSRRNFISGNPFGGISVFTGANSAAEHADNNQINGNYIGTDRAGNAVVAGQNGPGVRIERARQVNVGRINGVTVGGACTGGCNLISGNRIGVEVIMPQPSSVEPATQMVTGIRSNYIGTNVSGSAALGNQTFSNVVVRANDTALAMGTIGGSSFASDRNVISGSAAWGVEILSFTGVGVSNPVSLFGNYVGLNASGTAAIPNASGGVLIDNVDAGLIGVFSVPMPFAANTISGNGGPGIRVQNKSRARIRDNRIGVGPDGVTPMGNAGAGVEVQFSGSPQLIVEVNGVNTIAHNGGPGVSVLSGESVVVTNFFGGPSDPGNLMYANGGLPIDLAPAGPTPNDACDTDGGANLLQNSPIVTAATTNGTTTTVSGTLNSTASTPFAIDFWADPAGGTQARDWLGRLNVTTDVSCGATFTSQVLAFGATGGSRIIGVATNTDGVLFRSSELGAGVVVSGPPQVTKTFAPSSIGSNGTSTLTITIVNANASTNVNAIGFTDTYPSGITNAGTPAVSNTCGGAVTAASGGNQLQLSGGSLNAGQTCTVTVNVTGSVSGTYTNTLAAGSIASSAGPNPSPVSATLNIAAPPSGVKTFTPGTIAPGDSSLLTITLSNSNAAYSFSGVALTDTYPAAIVNAATPNASTTCGGILTATAGSNSLVLTGASLPASSSCTVSVNVTSSTSGVHTNTVPAGGITSAEGINSAAPISAALTVLGPPSVSKAFTPPAIGVGDNSQLSITIQNANSISVTGIAFTDTYPAGFVNATSPAASSSCGGVVTATPGGNSVSLSGATIPAVTNCVVTLFVTGTTTGAHANTIPAGGVTSTNTGPSTTSASATLTVLARPTVSKSFTPDVIPPSGTSLLSVTLTNPNATTITGLAFVDTFPAGVVVSGSPTNGCGGSAGTTSNSLSLSGGSLPSGTCTVSVNITSTVTGSHVNTIAAGDVTSTNAGSNTTGASATLLVANPLTVTKAFAPTQILSGGTSQLSITLTNPNASTAATGVALTDTYPTGVVNATPSNAATTCGGSVTAVNGANSLSFSGSVPANSSCTITVDITSATAGSHVNTIAAGDLTTTNLGSNTAPTQATLTVVGPPTVVKTFSADTVPVGGTALLTIAITNPNTVSLTDVDMIDNLPVNLLTNGAASSSCGGTATASGTSVTLDGATIPAGATCNVTVNVTSSVAGSYTNTIAAGGVTTANSAASTNSTSDTIAFLAPPTVMKAFSPFEMGAGSTSTLTITLSNPNASHAITGVAFTDTYPANVTNNGVAATTCGGTASTPTAGSVALSAGTIPAGGSCTVTVNVTSTTPGTYTNTIAAGDVTSGNAGSNFAATQDTLTVLDAPTVAKSFAPAVIGVDGTSTLTITLTNPNSLPITGASLTDIYPSGVVHASTPNESTTCGGTISTSSPGTVQLIGGTIPANGSCTVIIDVTSSTAGSYDNTIPAGGLESDNAPPNALPASANLLVLAHPSVTMSLTPAQVGTNESSTLTITLSNSNSTAITGVAFTNAYPSGVINDGAVSTTCGGTASTPTASSIQLTGGTIPASGSCTVTIDVTSSSSGSYGFTIAAGDVTSGNAGANTTPASATLDVLGRPSVTKQFSPSEVGAGATSTLTITLSNANSNAVTGIAFTDVYPANVTNSGAASTTCGGTASTPTAGSIALSAGTIPANGSCTVTIDVTSATPGTYTNTIAAGDVTSDNAGSNTAPAQSTLTVLDAPTIAKSFAPTQIGVDQTSTLTITITNPNALPITGASLTDTYPAGLVNAASPNASTTCGGTVSTPATNSVQLTGGSIPASGSCTITVIATSSVAGSYNNTIVAGDLTSTNAPPSSNAATANLLVLARPAVAMSFTPPQVGTNDPSTLMITLSNPNSTAISGAAFTNVYPSGVVNDGAATTTCGGTASTPTASSVQLAGGTIPANGSCTVTVDVTSSIAGSYSFTIAVGDVTSSNAGATTAPANATLVILGRPSVTKSFTPASIQPGETSTLTITLTNSTAQAMTGVAFVDSYPAEITNAASPDANSTCGGSVSAAPGGGSITLSSGVVAANGTCTVTVVVTASALGNHTNTIPEGGVTASDAASNDASASAVLGVGLLSAPAVTKTFSPTSIRTGETTTLEIVLSNPNVSPINDVAFVDNYPSGLVNELAPNASSTCGGTVIALPGGNSLSLSGGTIPANGTCSVTVSVTAADDGSFANVLPAGSVTSSNGEANATESRATLTVAPAHIPGVPTLDAWMLLALAMLIAAVGMWMIRS